MKTYAEFQPTGFDCRGLALDERQAWLVSIGRNRDSGALDRSNFECALKSMGGESDDVEVHRFGHWACGWFEIILVRPDSAASKEAEEIEGALANYPVLNDAHYSELESEEANETWRSYRDAERIDYMRKNREQFEFRSFADMLSCARGKYFAGYASELLS
jgi:hypothetical protein